MKQKQRVPFARRGISLMEVMVTIAIVLTLSSVVVMGVLRAWERTRVTTTWLIMGRVAQEVTLHQTQARTPPRDLAAVYGHEPVPSDVWGTPIELTLEAESDWDLVSWGRDQHEGGSGFATDLWWSERPH